MRLTAKLITKCAPIIQTTKKGTPWLVGYRLRRDATKTFKLGTALLIAALSNNPHVQFIFEEFEDAKARGYIIPGWYFWDETQSHVHGPYESESETIKALDAYALSLNPIET